MFFKWFIEQMFIVWMVMNWLIFTVSFFEWFIEYELVLWMDYNSSVSLTCVII